MPHHHEIFMQKPDGAICLGSVALQVLEEVQHRVEESTKHLILKVDSDDDDEDEAIKVAIFSHMLPNQLCATPCRCY